MSAADFPHAGDCCVCSNNPGLSLFIVALVTTLHGMEFSSLPSIAAACGVHQLQCVKVAVKWQHLPCVPHGLSSSLRWQACCMLSKAVCNAVRWQDGRHVRCYALHLKSCLQCCEMAGMSPTRFLRLAHG